MGNILIFSRNARFREECREALSQEGLKAQVVDDEQAVLNFLKQPQAVDVIVYNPWHSDADCRKILRHLSATRPRVPVVLACDYFNYWNDFTSWLADACVVYSPDYAEVKDMVREFVGSATCREVKRQSGGEFTVDWA